MEMNENWLPTEEDESPVPLTPQREAKFRSVLAHRQPGLTVILENIHDPHNISAILRSCDAVGIPEVHVINTILPKVRKLGKRSSASARKWVKVNFYDNVDECINGLREKGFRIYATHLSADAYSLYDLKMTMPTALVFGNEQNGCSDEILARADGNFIIPMVGMIPSLNVSVACAASLYEAFRQRKEAGMYDTPQLEPAQMSELFSKWTAK